LPFSELFQSFYIRLCPQLHLGCKFGETPTSSLQDIVSRDIGRDVAGPDSTVISSRSRSTLNRNVPLTSRTPRRCRRAITHKVIEASAESSFWV